MCMGLSFPDANKMLRVVLEAIGTENAGTYRTHDLRRGHAEDLRLSGGLFAVI